MDKIRKFYILCLVFFLLFLSACISSKMEHVYIVTNNMENTILEYSEVYFKSKAKYEKEDVIVVTMYSNINRKNMNYCFRVVGCPGDVIKIDSNVVYVNNKVRIPSKTEIRAYKILYNNNMDYIKFISSGRVEKINDSIVVAEMTVAVHDFERGNDKLKILGEFMYDTSVRSKNNMVNFYYDGGRTSYLERFRIPNKGEVISQKLLLPLISQSNTIGEKIDHDYYFLMSDKFFAMPDSRGFGLFPSDSIKGVVKRVEKKNVTVINVE